MVLKEKLKELLKAKDMTASQLSRKTGIAKTTVSDWLAGSPPKDVRQVKKAADFFGVSVDFLCFGREPVPRESVTDLEALFGDGWVGGMFEVRFRRVK